MSQTKNSNRKNSKLVLSLLLVTLVSSQVFLQNIPHVKAASTLTWDGGGACDGNWMTADCWVGDVAPVDGDSLVFPRGVPFTTNANNFPNNTHFDTITFDGSGAPAYFITGNLIILGHGITDNSSGGTTVFQPDLLLANPQTFSVTSGSGDFFITDVDLNNNNINVDTVAGGRFTFDGIVSGADGDITKIGSGTAYLNRNNTYGGETIVNGGTLSVGHNNGLGAAANDVQTGTSVNNDAKLFIGSNNLAIGTEKLTLNGTGGGDTVAMYESSSWGGSITLSTTANINVATLRTFTMNGVVDGPAGLEKRGDGTVQLNGSNTYAGNTSITAGTLKVGANEVIPNTSIVSVAASTTLNVGTFTESVAGISGTGAITLAGGTGNLAVVGNGNSTFGGVISGDGSVTKAGTGALNLDADNTYNGSTTINGGALYVNGQQPSSAVNVNATATLGGHGKTGSVVSTNGAVAPGNSPGVLHTGSVTFNAGSQFNVEINGTNMGVDYDVLDATGDINLGGATLNVTAGYAPTLGTIFTIAGGTGTLTGNFAGLAHGSVLNAGGKYFVVKYNPQNVQLIASDASGNTSAPSAPSNGGGGGGSSGGGGGSGGGPAGIYQLFNTGTGPGSTPTPAPNPAPVPTPAPNQPQQPVSYHDNSPLLKNFFIDTKGHWAEMNIDEILNSCKVAGYMDTEGNLTRLFKPNQTVTRAELFTMVMKCKVGPQQPIHTAPFADVSSNHWAAPYIARASVMGLATPYEDGTFRPNQPVTKAEALKLILLTWYTMQDIDATAVNNECTDVSGNAWYGKYFSFALNHGMMSSNFNGTSCNPNQNILRSESASILAHVIHPKLMVKVSPDKSVTTLTAGEQPVEKQAKVKRFSVQGHKVKRTLN